MRGGEIKNRFLAITIKSKNLRYDSLKKKKKEEAPQGKGIQIP